MIRIIPSLKLTSFNFEKHYRYSKTPTTFMWDLFHNRRCRYSAGKGIIWKSWRMCLYHRAYFTSSWCLAETAFPRAGLQWNTSRIFCNMISTVFITTLPSKEEDERVWFQEQPPLIAVSTTRTMQESISERQDDGKKHSSSIMQCKSWGTRIAVPENNLQSNCEYSEASSTFQPALKYFQISTSLTDTYKYKRLCPSCNTIMSAIFSNNGSSASVLLKYSLRDHPSVLR